jgi:inositol polyphosphate-4-phosphatase
VPIQLLKLFIAEERERVVELNELMNLCSEWAQSRDQKLQEHMDMITYYSDMVTDLEHYDTHSFKRSVDKANQALEFVATNLHIQRMKVIADQKPGEMSIYDFVTIGAPAAHSLKFRQGGVKEVFVSKELHHRQSSAISPPDTQTTEVRHLMQNIAAVKSSIDTAKETLLSSAKLCSVPDLERTMKLLKEKVDQLRIQCESDLILKGSQLAINALQKSDSAVTRELGDWVFNGDAYVRIPAEWHMDCLCQKLEQLCLWLESKVDCLCQLKHGIDSSWHDCVSVVVRELTVQVEMVMRHIQTCLNLVVLQDEHKLNSIGLSSPRHRKDIILSQAVNTSHNPLTQHVKCMCNAVVL